MVWQWPRLEDRYAQDSGIHFVPPPSEPEELFEPLEERTEVRVDCQVSVEGVSCGVELANLDILVAQKSAWRTPVLQGAIQFASMALQANWIVDEFDYSIGGISLSIDRSSKYEGLKSSAEQMWQQSVEAKARTTKYLRGLKQPKYGVSIRSAFGPHVGRGVLAPRNFL